MSIIHGLLERVTYHNEESDFVVAKLREKDKRELTTIVGNLSGINPGESLKLTGQWVHNKKFGEQFRVETFEVTIPATLLGIQKYLASGLIKGIGPVMSARIVEKFGLDTLEVIEKKPERLSEVEGIGPKRISMIKQAWEEQKEIKEIMIFLQGHGVSASYSAKIYKQYGNQSIAIVRENPYRLARDIYGTGFITADKIAQNLGIDRNSLIRAKAGLIYVMNQLTEEGHVYYPENQLIHKAREILHVGEEIVIQAIRELSKEKEIFLEDLDPEGNLKAAYLPLFYVAETGVARWLVNLTESPSNIRPIHPEKAIEWVQQKLNIKLAQGQEEAVLRAATSKVLIITGGPGTGKTTIITAILRIFQQLKLRILQIH